MAGNKNIFRPPLKRFTCLIRQDLTPSRFLELAGAQNPGFAQQQFHLWHTSRLPSGDSILVFGVEPGLASFIEWKGVKSFVELVKSTLSLGLALWDPLQWLDLWGPSAVAGPLRPAAVAGPSGPTAAGPVTPDDVEDLIRSVRSSAGGRRESVSLDWMVDRVRTHVALVAGGLRRASSSTDVIPPGVVRAAVAAVEGRVTMRGGAEAGSAAAPADSIPGKRRRKRRR